MNEVYLAPERAPPKPWEIDEFGTFGRDVANLIYRDHLRDISNRGVGRADSPGNLSQISIPDFTPIPPKIRSILKRPRVASSSDIIKINFNRKPIEEENNQRASPNRDRKYQQFKNGFNKNLSNKCSDIDHVNSIRKNQMNTNSEPDRRNEICRKKSAIKRNFKNTPKRRRPTKSLGLSKASIVKTERKFQKRDDCVSQELERAAAISDAEAKYARIIEESISQKCEEIEAREAKADMRLTFTEYLRVLALDSQFAGSIDETHKDPNFGARSVRTEYSGCILGTPNEICTGVIYGTPYELVSSRNPERVLKVEGKSCTSYGNIFEEADIEETLLSLEAEEINFTQNNLSQIVHDNFKESSASFYSKQTKQFADLYISGEPATKSNNKAKKESPISREKMNIKENTDFCRKQNENMRTNQAELVDIIEEVPIKLVESSKKSEIMEKNGKIRVLQNIRLPSRGGKDNIPALQKYSLNNEIEKVHHDYNSNSPGANEATFIYPNISRKQNKILNEDTIVSQASKFSNDWCFSQEFIEDVFGKSEPVEYLIRDLSNNMQISEAREECKINGADIGKQEKTRFVIQSSADRNTEGGSRFPACQDDSIGTRNFNEKSLLRENSIYNSSANILKNTNPFSHNFKVRISNKYDENGIQLWLREIEDSTKLNGHKDVQDINNCDDLEEQFEDRNNHGDANLMMCGNSDSSYKQIKDLKSKNSAALQIEHDDKQNKATSSANHTKPVDSMQIEFAPENPSINNIAFGNVPNKEGAKQLLNLNGKYKHKDITDYFPNRKPLKRIKSPAQKNATKKLKQTKLNFNKPLKTKKPKFCTPWKSQPDPTYDVASLDETVSSELLQKLTCEEPIEVVFNVLFKDSCQLSANSLEYENPCELLIGVFWNADSKKIYYVQNFEPYLRHFFDFILSARLMCRKICYDSKALLKLLLNVTECIDGADILDLSIGCWLLSPCKAAANFEAALGILKMQNVPKCSANYVSNACHLMTVLSRAVDTMKEKLEERMMWGLYEEIEIKLPPILALMERRGIKVDGGKLCAARSILDEKMKECEARAHAAAGRPFHANSAMQLRKILFEELNLGAALDRKQSGGVVKSTCQDTLLQLKESHPLPGIIIDFRRMQREKNTHINSVLKYISEGTVRPVWDQTFSATGRLVSKNPNLQSIPKTCSDQLRLREAYSARPDHTLLAIDFHHLEFRMFAHLAQDAGVMDVLRIPGDVFENLARVISGGPCIERDQRERTKKIAYAVMYGDDGPFKLQEILNVNVAEAKRLIASFTEKFPTFTRFPTTLLMKCKRDGFLATISGRRRCFPNINSSNYGLRAQSEHLALDFMIKGCVADICKSAMIHTERVFRVNPDIRGHLLLQLHDKLIWEIHNEHLNRATELISISLAETDTFCNHLGPITVPLPVVVSTSHTWNQLLL